MNAVRAVLVAAVLVLAVVAVSPVRASSSESWSSPASESWPSLEEFSSEIELAHAEFLDAVSASSSTGSDAPTTVTTYKPATVALAANYSSPADMPPGFADSMVQAVIGMSSTLSPSNVNGAYCFPPAGATNCSGYDSYSVNLTASSSRRLLADNQLLLIITITPSSLTDSTASIVASGVAAQLKCGGDQSCVSAQSQAMAAALTAATGTTVTVQTITQSVTSVAAASNNTALTAALNTVATQGVTVVAADPGTVAPQQQPVGYVLGAPTASTSGHARGTNAGYYVEAAILALTIVLSAMYMVMHKVNPNATTGARKEYGANSYGSNNVALEPVPSAEPATGGVAIVGGDEAAPLGAQGQMDYKSVFALRNNVLEHKDGAADEDNANQNDVHFILHQ